MHFQMSNPPSKGAVPLLERSIFLHDICSIIDIGHRFQKRNMFEIVSTTNSTAQGGGGSFKNRKPIGPIGEIRCCESGMADRIH